jgi:hypothetical protein
VEQNCLEIITGSVARAVFRRFWHKNHRREAEAVSTESSINNMFFSQLLSPTGAVGPCDAIS